MAPDMMKSTPDAMANRECTPSSAPPCSRTLPHQIFDHARCYPEADTLWTHRSSTSSVLREASWLGLKRSAHYAVAWPADAAAQPRQELAARTSPGPGCARAPACLGSPGRPGAQHSDRYTHSSAAMLQGCCRLQPTAKLSRQAHASGHGCRSCSSLRPSIAQGCASC